MESRAHAFGAKLGSANVRAGVEGEISSCQVMVHRGLPAPTTLERMAQHSTMTSAILSNQSQGVGEMGDVMVPAYGTLRMKRILCFPMENLVGVKMGGRALTWERQGRPNLVMDSPAPAQTPFPTLDGGVVHIVCQYH